MKDIGFSVIVTVFNKIGYIEKCLKSILAQRYDNMEIIVIDDGSTDGCDEVCDKYANNNHCIKVIHQKNMGLSCARKRGIEEASREYVFFVDADDWIDEDTCYKLNNSIIDTRPDIIVNGLYKEYEKKCVNEKNSISPGYYFGERFINEILSKMIYTGRFYERGIGSYICAKVIKRKIICRISKTIPNNLSFAEGGVWIYSCLMAAENVLVKDDDYYHYKMLTDSMAMKGAQFEDIYNVYSSLMRNVGLFREKSDAIREQLKYMAKYLLIWSCLKELNSSSVDIFIPYNIKRGAKVAIFGAWRFGRALYRYIRETQFCDVVAWVDSNADEYGDVYGVKIQNPIALKSTKYDYILLGSELFSVTQNMIADLLNMGIKDNVVILDHTTIGKMALPIEFDR